MTTEDFIIDLYCRIDDKLQTIPQPSQAVLSASELITLGMLFAIKGVGQRAFYRWIERIGFLVYLNGLAYSVV
jgi:hypothetical protein